MLDLDGSASLGDIRNEDKDNGNNCTVNLLSYFFVIFIDVARTTLTRFFALYLIRFLPVGS